MDKFIYVTSKDHLRWLVPPGAIGTHLSNDYLNQSPNLRWRIRTWIENSCLGRVYAWNQTSTPTIGSLNWDQVFAPQGHITLYFTHSEDLVQFQLVWCTDPGSHYYDQQL